MWINFSIERSHPIAGAFLCEKPAILNFTPPQGWCFTASAWYSVQAPSALALTAALNYEF